jgi:dihydrolipoamide dehydrogenase
MRQADRYGISVTGVAVDMAKLVAWKDSVVKRLTGGIGTLFGKHTIRVVAGTARFTGPGKVAVKTAAGEEAFSPGATIVATGSRPVEIPGFSFDGERILSSTDALALSAVPKRLLVIGGGYIGLELGIALHGLGSEVTVVELTDSILPGTDPELSAVVHRTLKKKKVRVLLGAKALGWKETPGGLSVEVETKKGREEIACDKVLLTVGRRPNSEGLGLDLAGLPVGPGGFIAIDAHCRTGAEGVFAIGDVAGQPMLAHKASREGIIAAEVIAGRPSARDWAAIPAVIFTDPEIASVGLTEAEAAAKGIETVTGKFPFGANGRALTLDAGEGFAKVVAEKGSGVVLGVHLVGPEAAELVSEGALAVEMGATLEDLALPETIMEAAEAALGHAIHIYTGK